MPRVTLAAVAVLLVILALVAACSNDPATPPAPLEPPPDDQDLDLDAILADYATGAVDQYAAALHDEFRFVTADDGDHPYARTQEIDLLQTMHAGLPGTGGEILQGVELVQLDPVGVWIETDRDDPLGAHRPDARKRAYTLTLRFTLANPSTVREVTGRIIVFADDIDDTPHLLGLVDQTDDGVWTDVRRTWATPQAPDLPGSPDLLSMRWIASHDGRDWLLMGELLHPEFRYLGPDGETGDRHSELALFADLMAGRPNRSDTSVAQLDAQNWEHTEGPWSAVGPDDPHFGDVPGALAQWLDIRIVYTTVAGEAWEVDGLVRMGAVETVQGWQLLGFVDDSADTGEPGSIGWSVVRAHFR